MPAIISKTQMVLKQPCRYCARLTKEEECPECRLHHHEYGHYPVMVWRRQVPGQPRLLARFCGECGRELR